MRKTKTGRLASKEERDYARAIVGMYKEAAKRRADRLSLDPDAEPDKYDFDASDPEYALEALGLFVEFGTFAPPSREGGKLFTLRNSFHQFRSSGLTYDQTIFELAKIHHVDTRTVERWLAKAERLLFPK